MAILNIINSLPGPEIVNEKILVPLGNGMSLLLSLAEAEEMIAEVAVLCEEIRAARETKGKKG
jgi:hypothetical protein